MPTKTVLWQITVAQCRWRKEAPNRRTIKHWTWSMYLIRIKRHTCLTSHASHLYYCLTRFFLFFFFFFVLFSSLFERSVYFISFALFSLRLAGEISWNGWHHMFEWIKSSDTHQTTHSPWNWTSKPKNWLPQKKEKRTHSWRRFLNERDTHTLSYIIYLCIVCHEIVWCWTMIKANAKKQNHVNECHVPVPVTLPAWNSIEV